MKTAIMVTLITIFVVLIGMGVFMMYQSTNRQQTVLPSPTIQIQPSLSIEPQYIDQKLIIDCSFYQRNTDFPMDETQVSGKISTIVGVQPSTHKLCGFSKAKNIAYFTTTLSDKNALDYYTRRLEAIDCSSEGVRSAPGDRRYKYSLPFSCGDGDGVIATLATVSGYVVMFEER